MTPRCSSFVLCLTAFAILPAMMLLPCPLAQAAKSAAKGKAAKRPPAKVKAKAKAKAETSSSSSSAGASAAKPVPTTPYEIPSPGGAEIPPSPPADTQSKPSESAPSSSSSTSSNSTTEATSSSESPKESPTEVAADSESPASAEVPLALVEEPAAPVESVPLHVDYLGPSTYPGKLRGIYGGSMWLEPSFNGLPWPHMASSGVGVSGVVWVDSGYERITRENDELPNTAMYFQQGRAVLRVTPTYTNGRFFIQGQVEVVGNQCQATSPVCTTAGTVSTDDLWIRVGEWNAWDLKVGRFEGWELYHTGMGLDINTLERQGAQQQGFNAPGGLQVPDYYGTNFLHDRPTAGLGVGYIAFHSYPSNNFRFELLGELGVDDTTDQGYTYLGARPALILDQGWLKVKVGAEYEKRTGATQSIDPNDPALGMQDSKLKRTRKGVGGTLQFVLDPRAEFGLNGAIGSQNDTPTSDGVASLTDTFTRSSVGGFANVTLAPLWILGAGANFTWQNDKYYYQGSQSPDYTAQLQAFLALQYHLARQLMIKAVLGYARADFVTSDPSVPLWSNYMYSGRIRLMYLY